MLDLSGLAVESIEVVPADSLDSATYGHGMPELAASCFMPDESLDPATYRHGRTAQTYASCFMPDESEDV